MSPCSSLLEGSSLPQSTFICEVVFCHWASSQLLFTTSHWGVNDFSFSAEEVGPWGRLRTRNPNGDNFSMTEYDRDFAPLQRGIALSAPTSPTSPTCLSPQRRFRLWRRPLSAAVSAAADVVAEYQCDCEDQDAQKNHEDDEPLDWCFLR